MYHNKDIINKLARVRNNINTVQSRIDSTDTSNGNNTQLDFLPSLHYLSTLSTLSQQLHTFRSAGLAVRIEVFTSKKYLEPFYLIMSREKGVENVININHHTIPSFIDIDSLGKRYLGWSDYSSFSKYHIPSSINTWAFIESVQLHLTAFAQRRLQANLCKQHLKFLGESLEIIANDGYQNIQFEWEINPLRIQTNQIGRGQDLGKLPYKRKVRVQIEFTNLCFSHLHIERRQKGGHISVEIILNSLPINSIRGYESNPPFVFPQQFEHLFWSREQASQVNNPWMMDLHLGISKVVKAIKKGDYVAHFPKTVRIPVETPPQPYQVEDDEVLSSEQYNQRIDRVQKRIAVGPPEDAQDNQLWLDTERAYESFSEKWHNLPKDKKIQKNQAANLNKFAHKFDANLRKTLPNQMKEVRNKVNSAEDSRAEDGISHFLSPGPLEGKRSQASEQPLSHDITASSLKQAEVPAEGTMIEGIPMQNKRKETSTQRSERKTRTTKARRTSMQKYLDRLRESKEKKSSSSEEGEASVPAKKGYKTSSNISERGPTPFRSQSQFLQEQVKSLKRNRIRSEKQSIRNREQIQATKERQKSSGARNEKSKGRKQRKQQ
ncbi:hypothetical protein E3P94_02812 [Wallemia ichthyophaga]|nr:hypothetical protein E3P95_02769 [Wallemia ichthyophaga]TIA98765.1 hypothetical protein E3P94_02812 [Wallemia ichthyophaga]